MEMVALPGIFENVEGPVDSRSVPGHLATFSAIRKKCQAGGPLCDSFSFKEDSVPINGGCWLFPKTAQLQEVEDRGGACRPYRPSRPCRQWVRSRGEDSPGEVQLRVHAFRTRKPSRDPKNVKRSPWRQFCQM
eukprot:Skav206987  [mRNA]  locus=scaffold2010:93701:94099:- [translate_table: standard]